MAHYVIYDTATGEAFAAGYANPGTLTARQSLAEFEGTRHRLDVWDAATRTYQRITPRAPVSTDEEMVKALVNSGHVAARDTEDARVVLRAAMAPLGIRETT